MAAKIIGDKFVNACIDAGIIPIGATKVIIEAEYDNAVRIHYACLGDDRLLDVVPALATPAFVHAEDAA